MTVRDAILETLDVYGILTDLLNLTVKDKNNDWRVECPFHDDDTASLNVQKDEGILHCFGCGYKGSIFDLVMRIKDINYNEAEELLVEYLDVDTTSVTATTPKKRQPKKTAAEREEEAETAAASRPPIDPAKVQAWHESLMTANAIRLDYLHTKWGISDATIRKFRLGFDGERYTIPIYDETGQIVNVRKYLPEAARSEDKMRNHIELLPTGEPLRYGTPTRLFPLSALSDNEIILVEGEKDAIIAHEYGFNALTTTGGAARWRESWNELFRGKRVFICYDQDKAGIDGTQKIAKELESVTGVYIVELPAPSTPYKGYDLANYFLDEGATRDEFLSVLLDAKTFSSPRIKEEDEPEPVDIPLALASHSSNIGKPLRTKAVVSGKNMAPYIVPTEVQVTCVCADGEKACITCPRWHKPGVPRGVDYKETITLSASEPNLLKLINCSDTQQKGYLKQLTGVDKKCAFGSVAVTANGNIQQIILIPELDIAAGSLDEQEYVSRTAYYRGHDIIANRSYTLTGYTWPHPMNQTATHVFDHKDDMQDSIKAFEMTPEIFKQLKETFSVEPGKTIDEKLKDIYNFHVKNTHGIRGRPEIQLAFDLVWHSVLTFDFIGQRVRKGWLEGLIVGDTSQGKTELTTQMLDYINLGQRITGEKTSAAGLIGGLQKIGDNWILQWGAYPQNDRRALLIDEYSSLHANEIANMTDLRSTGVAEVVKIRTERTNARVRAVLCSNLRSGLLLKDIAQGITGIKELMGKNEDVRRLDFAITVATGEVSLDEINKPRTLLPDSEKEYTREASKNLILWAWSRNLVRKNQVQFTEEAEQEILDAAQRMGRKYHARIPLVEPSDQRLKIARMATALACRLFSTQDGEVVSVEKEHVTYIVQWLKEQYDKDSMGYDDWSANAWASERFESGVEEELTELITELPNGDDIILFLSMQNKTFRQGELEAATGLDREDIKRLIHYFMRHNALSVDGNGYRIQPNLHKMVKKLKGAL